jgi:multicomponent Na+:H+ antiporter subunit B
MTEIILIVLMLLMIVGALVAIATPNLLHSVISVGAVGFLLSIVFLFLSAPDLAITQIAVETITLVLLLHAVTRSERDPDSDHLISFGKVVALVMVITLAIFSVRMLEEFPEFGSTAMDRFADAPSRTYLREGLEKTGAANIVTAVLLDYRAYDTLGEATVLFCALLGAMSILRRNAKTQPGKTDEEAQT